MESTKKRSWCDGLTCSSDPRYRTPFVYLCVLRGACRFWFNHQRHEVSRSSFQPSALFRSVVTSSMFDTSDASPIASPLLEIPLSETPTQTPSKRKHRPWFLPSDPADIPPQSSRPSCAHTQQQLLTTLRLSRRADAPAARRNTSPTTLVAHRLASESATFQAQDSRPEAPPRTTPPACPLRTLEHRSAPPTRQSRETPACSLRLFSSRIPIAASATTCTSIPPTPRVDQTIPPDPPNSPALTDEN